MKYCKVSSFCRFYNGIFHQKIEVFSKTNIMIFLAFFRTDEFNKNMPLETLPKLSVSRQKIKNVELLNKIATNIQNFVFGKFDVERI